MYKKVIRIPSCFFKYARSDRHGRQQAQSILSYTSRLLEKDSRLHELWVSTATKFSKQKKRNSSGSSDKLFLEKNQIVVIYYRLDYHSGYGCEYFI